MRAHIKLGILALGVLALGGCDLELNDPNNPDAGLVLSTTEGVMRVAIGMQAEYSGQLVDPVYVIALVTDELGAGPATFEIYQRIDAGGQALDSNLGPSESPWSGQYRVIKQANDLIRVTPEVGFGPGTTSGILALARVYKAMALGNLMSLYPSAPLDVGDQHANPAFVDRAGVLAEVLRLLEAARTGLASQAPSDIFYDEILAPGFDLENTIHAMEARYALMAGDHDRAFQAADRVDLSVLSVFGFSASDRNSFYNMWYGSGNAYQLRPEDTFRQEAEAGDQRVGYWVEQADIDGAVTALDDLVRYRTSADPIPAYFPDEMRLIQAEVHARANRIGDAAALINAVRTQCDSALDEPVACLPTATIATQAEALDEILKQRRYELYLQGVRWEDLRRFEQTLKYDYMPYPQSECDRNESAPC